MLNDSIILFVDSNNYLNAKISDESSSECFKYTIYKFMNSVRYSDIMTGEYYIPGFAPVQCNSEDSLKYWKNKLKTVKDLLEWEFKQFEKYMEVMYDR